MRGPKRRRREETSTTGRAKQARSTQPTRSNGGGRNAPKRAAQRPPDKPPAVERPGEPPEGGRTGGTRLPPRSARGALRRARNPTRQHTREAAARAAAAAALAGTPLATAKRACYPSRGGGRKPVGAGGPRKPRAQARRMGRTPKKPACRRNKIAAARGQSGTRAGPRDRSQGATERTATSAHPIRVCTQGRSPFLILIL